MRTWPYTLQRSLSNIGNLVERLILVVASLLLTFMAFTLFSQVLFRYVLKLPLPWTEEAARHALVWFAMLASAVAAKRGQHFSFRWATMMVTPETRLRLRRFVDVLTILLLSLILNFSYKYLNVMANQKAISTGMDMRIPYLAVTVGIFFIIFFAILDIADTILCRTTNTTLSIREQTEVEVSSLLAGLPKSDI